MAKVNQLWSKGPNGGLQFGATNLDPRHESPHQPWDDRDESTSVSNTLEQLVNIKPFTDVKYPDGTTSGHVEHGFLTELARTNIVFCRQHASIEPPIGSYVLNVQQLNFYFFKSALKKYFSLVNEYELKAEEAVAGFNEDSEKSLFALRFYTYLMELSESFKLAGILYDDMKVREEVPLLARLRREDAVRGIRCQSPIEIVQNGWGNQVSIADDLYLRITWEKLTPGTDRVFCTSTHGPIEDRKLSSHAYRIIPAFCEEMKFDSTKLQMFYNFEFTPENRRKCTPDRPGFSQEFMYPHITFVKADKRQLHDLARGTHPGETYNKFLYIGKAKHPATTQTGQTMPTIQIMLACGIF